MSLEKNLLERMKNYRYGRFNLINNYFDFRYVKGENIEIKNFYVGDKFGEGDCVKLTNDFCSKNLDLGLVRVEGLESKYFNEEDAVHVYSLFSEERLPIDFWKFELDEKIDFFINSNSYVVDPSYKLIASFKDSQYVANSFFEDNICTPLSLTLFNKNELGAPLGINSKDELIFLGKKNGKFSIYFQEPFEKFPSKYIFLEETSRIRGILFMEDDLQSICVNLSKKYVDFIENVKRPKICLENLRKNGL
jgi:hypothetical protein